LVKKILFSLLVLTAASLTAAEFQFDKTGVTAYVTPSTTTYWMCACVGTHSGSLLIASHYAIIPDADGDGVVRWELGNKMTLGGLWTMIDETAGTITTRYASGELVQPKTFPGKAFLRDELGAYSRLHLHSIELESRDLNLVWVRPGVGAWYLRSEEGDSHDEDLRWLELLINVTEMEPFPGAPDPPAGVEAGDYFIVLERTAAFWAGDRVSTHLAETNGPGVLHFNGATGDEDSRQLQIGLLRLEGTDGAASVDWQTSDGTALAGSHYVASSGTVVFNPGQIFGTFLVPLIDDQVDSHSASFHVTLTNSSGFTLGSASTSLGIIDNDDTPRVWIEERTIVEDGSGPRSVPMKVFLNHSAPKPATLEWKARDRNDGTTVDTGVLEIATGKKEETLLVRYVANDVYDLFRDIAITITSAVNATPSRDGHLTILEDDPQPVTTIGDAEVTESAGEARVTVRLSAPFGGGFSTYFKTEGVTATAGADFKSSEGWLTFPANSTSATIIIPITDDAVAETDETFDVVLSNTLRCRVTIHDDDSIRRRAARH
jgi:hypothetical protein